MAFLLHSEGHGTGRDERLDFLTEVPIAVGEVLAWTAQPDCGATVTFFGTVRDHARAATAS